MRRVRAYSRDERKRLIIHVLAETIRTGNLEGLSCAAIAQKMDIVPSTKLRQILAEMIAADVVNFKKEPDAGIAGFRVIYSLNYQHPAFSQPHTNRRAQRIERNIRLNHGGKVETLTW